MTRIHGYKCDYKGCDRETEYLNGGWTAVRIERWGDGSVEVEKCIHLCPDHRRDAFTEETGYPES